MLENTLKIILTITTLLLFVSYPIAVFKSYKYVKKNLHSLSNLFFGDPKYYKKLDWANHLQIEMAVGAIAALRFRELKYLKETQFFLKDTCLYLLISMIKTLIYYSEIMVNGISLLQEISLFHHFVC